MTDGKNQIRRAIANLGEARGRLVTFAQVSDAHLDAFAKGTRDLSADVLGKVVAFVFNDLLTYDADADALVGVASRSDAICLCTADPPMSKRAPSRYKVFGDIPTLTIAEDGVAGMRAYLGDAMPGNTLTGMRR
jgi:hypothetical protein